MRAPEPPDAEHSSAAPAAGTAPGVRLPVAVALVVGALVAAVLGVGAVASASADRLPSGPPLPPPPPPAEALTVRHEAASRAAFVRELHLVLPGAPYSCDPSPRPREPTFSSVVTCSAPVHENYRGSDDWTATTGLGVLADALVVPDDPQRTADRVFAALRRDFFSGQQTRRAKLTAQPFERAPAGRGVAVTGNVHYEVAGVPSRYDRLVVLVVQLADGGYGVWFSSRPDDTPGGTRVALDQSIETLSAQ